MSTNLLVLCTGNSCRSQMAEGYLRQFVGDRYTVYSAGLSPKDRVHPLAVEVMAEDGIDISAQRPKDLGQFLGKIPVTHLFIVCSNADESCPRIFPGMGERHFWPFDDPDKYEGPNAIQEFRRVRDEVKARIQRWQSESGSALLQSPQGDSASLQV